MIKSVLFETVSALYLYRNQLFKAAVGPFILLLIISFSLLSISNNFLIYFLWAISIIIEVYLAVRIHRVILLKSNAVVDWALQSWSKREMLFLMHYAVFIFIGFILEIIIFRSSLLTMYVDSESLIYLYVFSFLPVLYLLCRLSLVFPSIAIDEALKFKQSWEHTKKHQFLMLNVIFLLPIIFLIPLVLLLVFFENSVIINTLINWFLTVIQVSLLSIAYKNLLISK